MKVKYLKKDILRICRENPETIFSEIISSRRKTLPELLERNDTISEMSVEMNPLVLDMSKPGVQTDSENAVRVYKAMHNLTDSQASEEGLWAAYTLYDQLDYMLYRWPIKKPEDIFNHFLFKRTPHVSLLRNGIARLWWIARLTFEPDKKDKFALTRFAASYSNIFLFICEQGVFMAPQVIKGTLHAMMDAAHTWQDEIKQGVDLENRKGVKITDNLLKEIGRYFNLLSGVYLLDLLTEKEIYDLTADYIQDYRKSLTELNSLR